MLYVNHNSFHGAESSLRS